VKCPVDQVYVREYNLPEEPGEVFDESEYPRYAGTDISLSY